MSVDANERTDRAHKDALQIVKSSASLVAAVGRAATHAPYWIDATNYPPRRIGDPHEPQHQWNTELKWDPTRGHRSYSFSSSLAVD